MGSVCSVWTPRLLIRRPTSYIFLALPVFLALYTHTCIRGNQYTESGTVGAQSCSAYLTQLQSMMSLVTTGARFLYSKRTFLEKRWVAATTRRAVLYNG